MTETYAGDVTPAETWEKLSTDPKAVLVDLRTTAEWSYVGIPDLSSLGKEPVFLGWKLFPAMELNADFTRDLEATGIDAETPLFFLCRSGIRSKHAAAAMTALGYKFCYNILTGFEGDKDPLKHRNTIGGWKVDGLPWVQG